MALKPLNSVAGFSVGQNPANIILANGDITTNNFSTTGIANLNSIGNVYISGGSAGQVIKTDGAGNLSFVSISSSVLSNGNSNITVLANANITFSSTGNANIVVISGTGANVIGYFTVDGNITANGNISANNYLVTPSSKDLIIAPATTLTRFYSNVNPYADASYSLGNGLARWTNIYTQEANVSGNAAVGGLLTDHLYYANGTPWDLQEAAGANTQIQYNNGTNNNFGASANFTYDDANLKFTVLGNAQFNNANLGNLATANYINVSSNITVTNLVANTNVDFTGAGNVSLGPVGNIHITGGSNGQVLQTDGLGNLAWTSTANINEIQNGNSNVYIPIANGNVYVNANAAVDKQWAFGTDGTLTFPLVNSETSIQVQRYGMGNLVGYNDGGWVIGEYNGTNYGTEGIRISPGIEGNVEVILPSDANAATQPLRLNNYSTGNVQIESYSYYWNFDSTGNTQFPAIGTVDLGNLATANYVNVVNQINGNIANFSGNLTSLNANLGNLANANNITAATLLSTQSLTVTADANITGNANVTGNVSGNNISATGNISTTGAGGDITMSGGNITGVNDISANTANYAANVRVNNLTVNLELSGSTANFTGNINSALNANLGNLVTANYVNVANDLNVLGNIYGANIIGALANGNSNVEVYSNANVEITIGGVANTATFAATGLYVVGQINTTAGNILSNGNITANSFVNSANANVTGQANVGSLLTSNITATSGVITISASGTNQNIILSPSGVGNIEVGLHNIVQVGAPVNPNDAATKEYVDNVAQGLSIHAPVTVTSTTNLNSTYNDGGTVLTTTDITSNKILQFSANHGLSLGDEIYWSNTFDGITALNAYFVYSIPALNQITVKNGFYGAEVTTLTNATGLTQAALGNPGVGATLTNAGANAVISIDSITLSSTNRVLVQGQTNAYENGVYVVTTIGAPDSPGPGVQWVLTRSSDTNTYDPKSSTGLAYGDYFFVEEGTNSAGSSYVLTVPVGEILFGVSDIGFSQFSAAGSYTSGAGIAINGTIISANVDEVTTTISGGNIVVKNSANLTTPNIGDASFSSLSWNNLSNGNVTANNLSIGNIANITGNLRVDGIIRANGNINSNANINGNNAFFTNLVDVGGNLLANYITANYTAFAANANVSGTTITNALTVNLNITGNTANFSGNVFAPAIIQNASTYDTRLSLNSAAGIIEITSASNSTQFGPSGTITLGGASQIIGGTFGGSGITLGGSQTDIFQNRGGNVTIKVGAGGSISNTWTFAQDGSFTSPGNINSLNANLGNLATANYFTGTTVTANSSVYIGPASSLTTITSGNITTSSVSANQTIASLNATGITGVEFLVKAIDSGGKYSVATVQAVTDGTDVDYAVFGTVQIGGYTGSLVVNVIGGYVRLQVTPASSNSTVWITQARTI